MPSPAPFLHPAVMLQPSHSYSPITIASSTSRRCVSVTAHRCLSLLAVCESPSISPVSCRLACLCTSSSVLHLCFFSPLGRPLRRSAPTYLPVLPPYSIFAKACGHAKKATARDPCRRPVASSICPLKCAPSRWNAHFQPTRQTSGLMSTTAKFIALVTVALVFPCSLPVRPSPHAPFAR